LERLSHKELSAFLGFLRGLYATDSRPAFAHHIISELPKVLPSDVTGYNEVDPLKVKAAYVCHPADVPVPEPWIFEQHMRDHPVISYHQKTRDGRARKISDFLTRNQFHRIGLYNEFFHKVDVEYQISLSFQPQAEIIGISLNRSRKDFSERERNVLNLLRPHLIQAYHNVEATTQIAQEITFVGQAMDVAAVGTMVLAKGRVRFMTSRVREMLNEYFPKPSRNTGEIPESLREWIDEQLALLNRTENLPAPIRPLVIERKGKRMVVRLLTQPNQTLLIFQEQRTAPKPDDLQPLGLTARETEVLFWVAQGKTNEETGSILTASARTVAKHLERIYQKLGVENRTAAAILALTFLT